MNTLHFTAGGNRYELCPSFTLQQDAALRQLLDTATIAQPAHIQADDTAIGTITALIDSALATGELSKICATLAAPAGKKWTPATAAAATAAIDETTDAAEKASILDFFASALTFFLLTGQLSWTLSTPPSRSATQPLQ